MDSWLVVTPPVLSEDCSVTVKKTALTAPTKTHVVSTGAVRGQNTIISNYIQTIGQLIGSNLKLKYSNELEQANSQIRTGS